jgi:hypothetical protein
MLPIGKANYDIIEVFPLFPLLKAPPSLLLVVLDDTELKLLWLAFYET